MLTSELRRSMGSPLIRTVAAMVGVVAPYEMRKGMLVTLFTSFFTVADV